MNSRYPLLPFSVLPIVALLFAVTTPAAAQVPRPDPIAGAVSSWVSVIAPPGEDDETARRLAKFLPDWTPDGHGNLVRHVGSGVPRRVVACGIDVPAYVVSQITPDGYLRLRRTGSASHPLWDQFHEAQRVTVFTANGRVPGVVAVANGHFTQQHRADTVAATTDDLWVDVGASSAEEASRAGIALLDPLAIDRPAWTFEGFAAGPAAGARAGCAAVATAATARLRSGETIFVISAGRSYGWLGLSRAMASLGRVTSLTIVDDGASGGSGPFMANDRLGRSQSTLARVVQAESIRVLAPRVRYAGSMAETIHATDARALLTAVMEAAGVTASTAIGWVALPLDSARALPERAGLQGRIERQWMALTDLPGVAGHEAPVREAVLAALPGWARARAVVDSIGNIIVAMGPDRDSVAVLAHTDEVGFEVTDILGDGRVSLRTRGGAVVPSWEGVPAYLHFDRTDDATPTFPATALRGVFVPRDAGRARSPGALTAWFGMDSAQLVARGVRAGMSLTAYKRADRLIGTRVTGRASDDRTGSTALLLAIQRIDPDSLTHKVIFVWTVQEEGGLNGARFFGDRYGKGLRRVYSVDTFVSSDTPIESPHFAFAPLGDGAVLRAVDNASLVPRAERERIIAIAQRNSIPLQVGTTFGSTDGSAIQQWGPVNIGLSWPGRYSHGPAEVLDLRDVEALVRLVVEVAKAP
jgi:putative aminopeptidase FrvX